MIRLPLALLGACIALATTAVGANAQAPAPPAAPAPAPAPGATYAPVGAAPAGPKAPAPTGTSAPPAPGQSFQTFAQRREMFVLGDYIIHPTIHDEFTPGTGGKASYRLRGGTEFNLGNFQGLLEGEFRNFTGRHESSPVTAIGRGGLTFVPAFDVEEQQLSGKVGIKLLEPRLYVGIGYLTKSNNAGYPKTSGLGVGIEKLPDKEGPLSVYFSTYYYPNLTGQYRTVGPNPGSLGLTYRLFTYEVGAAIKPSGSPIFLNAGLLGDRVTARNSSPANQTRIAPYVGVGFFTR